jgi:hypothetical protein
LNPETPFSRFYGEATVQACLLGDCHYLDISGEPEFIEKIAHPFAGCVIFLYRLFSHCTVPVRSFTAIWQRFGVRRAGQRARPHVGERVWF